MWAEGNKCGSFCSNLTSQNASRFFFMSNSSEVLYKKTLLSATDTQMHFNICTANRFISNDLMCQYTSQLESKCVQL